MISQSMLRDLNNSAVVEHYTKVSYGRFEDIMIEAEKRLSEHEWSEEYPHPDIPGWVQFDGWEDLPSDLLDELVRDLQEGRL